MSVPLLSVQYPFRLGTDGAICVQVLDPTVVGSARHVLRLDFYPFISPSHPKRHMACFDVPLDQVKGHKLRITLRKDGLEVNDGRKARGFRAVWTGGMPLSGYARVTTSLELREGNALRRLDAAISSHLVLATGLPMALEWVQFPVTQYCNLTCPMCPRQRIQSYERAHVSTDVLSPVLDAAPSICYLGLQGLGEPLQHPELPRMVKNFRDRLPDYGRIAVTTNGTLLTRTLASRLFDAGLNTVTFSIDGASREVYEARRTGASFDRLCENVSAATKLARATGRKDLWLGTNLVMAPENVAEIPEFVRLCARLGLTTACFFWGREYPSMRMVELDPVMLTRVKDEAIALGRSLGVGIYFAKPRSGPLPECPFMSGVYLWLSGEVVPCHRMEPPGKPWPTRIMGNVRRQSLLDIWNALDARAFRHDLLMGELPMECRGCTFPESVVVGG